MIAALGDQEKCLVRIASDYLGIVRIGSDWTLQT
jgi:hypothetical protein